MKAIEVVNLLDSVQMKVTKIYHMENPTDFKETKCFGGHVVELVNTSETNMGGPRVGRLVVDGKRMRGIFGGPFFGKGDMLYVPKFHFKIFRGRIFDLIVCNLSTGKNRCVAMDSSGFGVLDADDVSVTLISGLGNNAVWKFPFVW